MQKRIQEQENRSSVFGIVRRAAAHVSVVAMIGVGTVSIALPVIAHAQYFDADTGGAYVPQLPNWESESLNYLQMHLPERGQAGVAGSTYPEALISPHQASQVASGSGQGVVAGSPFSGSGYFPYVDSAHAGTWSPLIYQQTGAAIVSAPATPIASIDLMRYVYADSQTPIEQQAYQQGGAGAVVAAPATPIASVDVMRGVYAEVQLSTGQQALLAAQGVIAEGVAGEALAITPDGWPVSQDEASAFNPAISATPVSSHLARAPYGSENFLFWVPGASAIVEGEPGPVQAFITPHRPGDAI